MTWLQWASPAFNPENDPKRWENAAKYAAEVMDFKITQDGAHGFDPTAAFTWTDPNSPEIIWSSDYSKGSTMENLFYPDGFLGTGGVGPGRKTWSMPSRQRTDTRSTIRKPIITRTRPTPTAIPFLQHRLL